MDKTLLTSSVLPQTSTFLYISGTWSEGGGLLSSGVVMLHVDKQWSDSWIFRFILLQSATTFAHISFSRDRTGRTSFYHKTRWPVSEGHGSVSAGISRSTLQHFSSCLCGESKRQAKAISGKSKRGLANVHSSSDLRKSKDTPNPSFTPMLILAFEDSEAEPVQLRVLMNWWRGEATFWRRRHCSSNDLSAILERSVHQGTLEGIRSAVVLIARGFGVWTRVCICVCGL